MYGLKDNKILFYYDREAIFNDVCLMSAYMGKSLGDVDKYAITTDEKAAFDLSLKTCLPNIYDKVIKLTSGLDFAFTDGTDAVSFDDKNAAGNAKSRTQGQYLDFYINNYDAFNANVLTMVDASMEECIKYGTLMEYYSICLEPNLLKIATERYASVLASLEQRLFQLKKRVSAKDNLSL